MHHCGWTLPPFTQLAGRVVVENDHLVALVESLVSRTQIVVVRVDLLTVASVHLSPVGRLFQASTQVGHIALDRLAEVGADVSLVGPRLFQHRQWSTR